MPRCFVVYSWPGDGEVALEPSAFEGYGWRLQVVPAAFAPNLNNEGKRTMQRLTSVAALMALSTAVGWAQEPVIGTWKTQVGTTAVIDQCSQGYCITMKTGDHAGKQIGSFQGRNGSFTGIIVEPESKKTFDGVLTVSGNTVRMKGCTMKVFCVSLIWKRL